MPHVQNLNFFRSNNPQSEMAANIFEKLSEMFSSLKADDGDDEEEEEEEVLFEAQHAFGHHSNVS